MLKKNNFFKGNFISSKRYNHNLNKTKIIFKSFLKDYESNKIPLLQTLKKLLHTNGKSHHSLEMARKIIEPSNSELELHRKYLKSSLIKNYYK